MWFLLLYLQISAIQGLNVALRGSNSPCAGRLEVCNKGGQWGLVCHFEWTPKNGQVVCNSLKCGPLKQSGVEMSLYKESNQPKKYLMDRVKCTSNESSLWDCPFSSKADLNCKDGSFVAVECSGNVEPSLNLNGLRDKCAGLVEFSTKKDIFGVCYSGWDMKKANKTCQELNCGTCHHIPKPGVFVGQQSKQTVSLECSGENKYSWKCMELSNCQERASVICTKHMRFRLEGGDNVCSGFVEMQNVTDNSWVRPKDISGSDSAKDICTQLKCGTTGSFDTVNGSLRLTCSDKVKVLNFTQKCFGDVSINVNDSIYGVCYSKSYETLGTLICREFGCGEMIRVEQNTETTGFLSDVECQGNEPSLWHCLAKHGKKQCPSTTVICAGSLDVRLMGGLSKCSGRVELRWKGSWKSISSKDWTTENSNVVCEHLNCGKSTKMNKNLFTESTQNQLESSWNFKCNSSSAKLHKCLKYEKQTNFPGDQQSSVQIICQKEELMFFKGDSPCRGKVRIQPFDGDAEAQRVPKNKTEANEICSQMKCGNATHENATHDNVICTGSVSVALRNHLNERCWGRVEVCKAEDRPTTECRGVCNKTWEDEESRKICDNLGCGDPIKSVQLQGESKRSEKDYNVYCLKGMKNITMCKFIEVNSCSDNTAKVICSGSIKATLDDPRDKCAGKVSLFYPGKWTPVCKGDLNKNLQAAICKELNCGEPSSDQGLTITDQDDKATTGISGIRCHNGTKSVSNCDLKGISIKQCPVSYLKCTGQKRLLLYKEAPCSGLVYALSDGEIQHVSGQGWRKEEGQKLCEYLQCGNYTSHKTEKIDIKEWWDKTYNCSEKEKIWECERQDQAIQLHEQLNINCTGNPDVRLTDYCTGNVLMDNKHVCSHLDDQMSNKICFSLGCGNVIHHWGTKLPVEKNCLHPSCSGKETMLEQCGTKEERCDKILSVACEKAIAFRSTKKCGGKLLVKYKHNWEYVCGKLNETHNAHICKELNCKTANLDESKIEKEIMVTINCSEDYHNITECLHHFKEGKQEKCTPVEIKCEGYIEEVPSTVNSGLIVGLLLGVLGLLIMVFMWMNRKRLLLALRHYRNKNGKIINTDRNEMNNMDKAERESVSDMSQGNVSSLEYADVDSIKNKTGEEDADDRSEGSSGTEYDDVEGQNSDISPHQTHADADLPLLPKRPSNILADQDTYEVETENQEDYDDVMPIENAERADTQAQVDVDAGTDSEAGTGGNADAVVVTTEVDVHAKQEE